jgi:sporulation protein YunB
MDMGRRFRIFLIRVCLVLLLILVGLALIRGRVYPVFRSLAQTHVKNTASDLINDAIAEQIEAGNIQYDRIVYFEKDLNGRITALKTNIGEINRLKTDVLNIINDEILSTDESSLGVALGSMFLPEFLSGKGPKLPVRILVIRNSEADFYSEFSEAGINQTLHKLNMEVFLDVTVLVLGSTMDFTISSHMVVAETVIVGDVPQTYLQTGG